MTTTDHRRAARDLATDLAARGASLQGDRGVTGLRFALWRLANIVASIPAPQQPQDGPEPAPEGDGTTDPGSGPETGAQRFKVGDRVQVRVAGSDYAAAVIKADDGRFCRVRHDDGGHTAFAHVSWLEPLPGPFDPPAVEPTPDEIDRLRASLSEAEDTIARLRKERDAHAVRALAFRAERVEIEGELDEARDRIERAWSLVNNYHGLGVPTGMLADALGAPLDDAGTVA